MNDVAVKGLPRGDRATRRVRDTRVTLAHGGGGKAMRDLIQDVFVSAFDNPLLAALEDQAVVDLSALAAHGDRLAFTTDSFVVTPLFFPGGDIGALAVNGTVNDLAMSGATPLFLSCGVVLEEGLDMQTLRRVAESMRCAAAEAGVAVVTGDTKVVERGAADKLFINTAGIGVVPAGISISASRARPGDLVLVNGPLGDHGVAILLARNELKLEADVASDCQPLHGLVASMLAVCPDIHCLRDATRGGLASVLNEFAAASIGFVYANVYTLREYAGRIKGYLDAVGAGAAPDELRRLRSELRIDRLMSDLVPLVDGTVEGVERMRHIVQDLRRYSASDKRNRESIRLAQLIENAVRWATRGTRRQIVRHVPEDLVAFGYEGNLHQVIVNLVQNALDAMEQTPSPRLAITARREQDRILVTVQDNGHGIAELDLPRIFDPFFTTKPVGKGTGLGLSITEAIVRDHDGSISVASTPEGGALFTIVLPAAKDGAGVP